MTSAYRDDLEAALARVRDLEREVEELRKRNAELESGDRETLEARENARRLEAAIERERDEQKHRFEAELAELEHERARIRRAAPTRRDRVLAFAGRAVAIIIIAALATLAGIARYGIRVERRGAGDAFSSDRSRTAR